jgi:PAS domain S-box-containing protein
MVNSIPGLRAEPSIENENARLRKEVAELKQALQSTRDLIQIAPAFFGFVSPEGKVRDLNDLALAIIEARRELIVGRLFWECPWWSSLPLSAERIREAVSQGAQGLASQFDIEYRAFEGGKPLSRWVAVAVTPFKDSSSRVTHLAVSGIDITERKLAVQEIGRSREDLRSFFMQSPIPMVITEGPEHRFTLANPPYKKLIGRKAVGKTLLEVFTKEEASNFIPILDEVYRTGVPYIGKEVPLDLPDESGIIRNHWITFGYHPFRDSQGRIKGIFAIVQDVTEQMRTAASLAAERDKLEAIFQGSPAAMAVWSGPDLIFDKVNPGYQALFSDRELEGKPFLEALPEFAGQPFAGLITRVLETGEPFVGREVLARHARSKDGPIEDRYYDFTYVRINDSAGRPFGVYNHAVDVTDRVLVQRALETSKSQLERTVGDLEKERELRERFVAALTHDLRTPLTAAKMSAQLLLRRGADPAQLQRVAGRIVDTMDRADGMIRDLLDAGRIKAGERIPLKREECDLTEIAQATVEDMASVHGDRFVLVSEGAVPAYCDRSAVRRMIENLVGNAVKYGAGTAPVTIYLKQEATHAEILVHNEGNPIPEHEQDVLFEAYQRLDSAGAPPQKGWGIGLMLVRGFARAHGGSVSVKSSETEGTLFTITLPHGPVKTG